MLTGLLLWPSIARVTYIRAFRHESEVLRGNPWGDPHVREVPVYLPPDYSDRRREPYPVVFLLAGWGGRGAHYLGDGGAFAHSLAPRLDHLIETKQIPPAIVVFPDGSSRLGASQYVNSSANGPYMDYVCDELVDWVDDRFHTHRSRDYRGVIGHSSGGFGALVFGMQRSDRFSAIASSAGDCWYDHLYVHVIPTTITQVEAAGGIGAFVDTWLTCPNPLGLLGREATIAMLTLSMAPCFLPNVDIPHLRGELWFDIHTGALLEDPYRRLLSWDPLHMVDQHLTALRSLRWIHLQAGQRDEYGLQLGHRQLSHRLTAHGIAHVAEEYPGRHGGHHHRMPDRIGRMVEALLEP